MFSLLLATAFSAMLSIVMRVGDGRVRSKIAMLTFNYLTCVVLTGLTVGMSGVGWTESGIARTVGMGLINGVFYVAALIAMQYNLSKNGVVLPSVFSKTGALMVPLVVSAVLFREIPGMWQTVGALLAVVGILLMNYRKGSTVGSTGALMILLLSQGVSSSMSKVYREWGASSLADHFLLLTFFSAMVICIFLIVRRKDHFGVQEAFYGILIGIPNFVSSRLLLKSLNSLPAIIVYPVHSVGTIVLVTLVGLFVFRERLSRRQMIAMAVIMVALAMLNL